jgi:hypothetical protein
VPREGKSVDPVPMRGRRNLITFAPEGFSGVVACRDGVRWAAV